ncbi:PleD family two-component system response regulator [Schlesneria paludicola]|uniref:hypothetical protein n=1 Tax=Schlesneria paludicola TaxID=360056 RepID=UPI00029A2675|nr:hypothetical protein [Schlesneria paludicola]
MVRIRCGLTTIVAMVMTLVSAVAPVAAQPKPPQEKSSTFDRSPLLKEPKTPEEMFAATLLTVDLIRPDLAVKYFDQFEAAEPDDELLLKLRDQYGTGDFLKLARTKELQPRSAALLERLNAAARKQAEDPDFLAGLVQNYLQAKNRELAFVELRNAGVNAVPEILKQLSLSEATDQQDALFRALTKMGDLVIPPMLGALDSPKERIQISAVDVLNWLDASVAIPYLWFPAFDENQPVGFRTAAKRTLAKLLKGSPERAAQLSSIDASNELRRLARLYYRNPGASPIDDNGQISLWYWKDSAGTVAQQTYPPDIAGLLLSARFARQALSLSPDSPEPQRQYLGALLGLEVTRNGWDKPRVASPDSALYLAMTAGEEMVSQVLSEALEAGQSPTALAALEVLSQNGSREQLSSQKGVKSPVIAALNSPDPRVQFAAATTILKLDPKTAFSGSTRVVSILARALTDPGKSRAIVIDADGQRASQTAGFLADHGYDSVVCATGREGFEQAATSAGVEVIVINVNCMRWDLTQTLANLRADARTAATPIVIYGPSANREDVSRVMARSAPATFVAQSPTASDFLAQFVPFMANQKTPPLSDHERSLQKGAAVYWLAIIGSGNMSRLFDISQAEKELELAVEDPAVAMNALVALGSIPARAAQQKLAYVALNAQVDDALREAASGQLAYHIQRHGLLLTRDEVIRLQAGWKQTDRPGVKSALASVMGSLRPDAAIVGERLRQFPVPPAN